ncbi:MAG: hypothetical protein ABI266_00505 [Ginsengibacter sp.]
MKKLSIILLLMLSTFSITIAQVTTPPAKKTVVNQDKVAMAAQKKAAKDLKASSKGATDAKAVPVSNTTTVRMSKSGTPDKRFTANKQPASPATSTVTLKNNGTPDKRFSANKQVPVPVTAAVHVNKNGTPDKRFNANKQPTIVPQVTKQVQPAPTVQAKTIATPAKITKTTVDRNSTVKIADKAIGSDAKGRTIYLGPKGGKYYLDKNGNKEYIK